MSKLRPYLKLYAADLMTDPHVVVLTWDQRGRYLWALMHSWASDTPGVATVSRWALWLGYSGREWERNRAMFEPLFVEGNEPGQWVQKRLLAEYTEAVVKGKVNADAGKIGAAMRWKNGHR